MSDPLYYPALVRAGVSVVDAAQYVAYYQHVMAQDTCDKWRDEVCHVDTAHDTADKQRNKQHSHTAQHIPLAQLLHAVGGDKAMRQLRFVRM